MNLYKLAIFMITALVIMVIVVPVPTSAQGPVEFARNETLYVTGDQWAPPSNWNPWNSSGYSTGTVGLIYETLFVYDPLADTFTPWLAESAVWTTPTTWQVKLRPGITWTDGRPLTAGDVKFTVELADPNGSYKGTGLAFQTIWDSLTSVQVQDDFTLDFNFNQDPPYQLVGYYLMYQVPIVPQHIWRTLDVKDISTSPNLNPIGSGMYIAESMDQTRAVLVRNDNWWGIQALRKTPAPKRIVGIVVPNNNVGLTLILESGIDLYNNYLPNATSLIKSNFGIKTYYPDAPYMLPARTVQLLFNMHKEPMDDVSFRRAMAYAINVNNIVKNDYTDLVQASDPTGLLPSWDKYIDKAQSRELGWSYDPVQARQILAAAGYKDTNGDGFVEAPDGSAIELRLTCPNGWTDWMAAIQMISQDAAAVGVHVIPAYPEYGDWLDAMLKGTMDMTLQSQVQPSSTVHSYYMWVFQHPLDTIPTARWGNYGRCDNPEAFELVDRLARVQIGDDANILAIASKLQRITMTDLPTIPLWYNGMWSQVNDTYWTGWSSAAPWDNHYLPTAWRGYWNMSAGRMLLELKQAPPLQ